MWNINKDIFNIDDVTSALPIQIGRQVHRPTVYKYEPKGRQFKQCGQVFSKENEAYQTVSCDGNILVVGIFCDQQSLQ